MKLQTLPVSVALATLIGASNTYLVIWAWAYIGQYTPLPQWLVSHGATGATFKGVLFFADFLTNMVLCAPAAYLLCKLRPAKLRVYLVAALLPAFLWQYHLVLGDIALLRKWQTYLPGALLAVLPLPATALIIRRLIGGAPNSSFKPTPRRGAA